MQVSRLADIRAAETLDPKRVYEALNSVQSAMTQMEAQTNTNSQGAPQAPPPIQGLKVSTGPGGEFQAEITDSGNVARGVKYFIEHANNPHFTNPHIIDNGTSRNWSGYMGAQRLYWRAYSGYDAAQAGAPAYHGSQANPLPVTGGVPGIRARSQGAGTGAPGQGLYGPGPVGKRGKGSGFDPSLQG
jgi:hypothetical protein